MCYLGDLLFWARNERDIAEACKQLWANEVNLEPEDNSAGILEVRMHCNSETGTIEMKYTATETSGTASESGQFLYDKSDTDSFLIGIDFRIPNTDAISYAPRIAQ